MSVSAVEAFRNTLAAHSIIMETNIEKGKAGEQKAEDYLKKKGYDILARNYRAGRDEIDIIAFAQGTIVFVEVKYRTSDKYGMPEDSIDSEKMQRIAACAKSYMMDKNQNFPNKRFDVISIIEKDGSVDIEHIEDAFWP